MNSYSVFFYFLLTDVIAVSYFSRPGVFFLNYQSVFESLFSSPRHLILHHLLGSFLNLEKTIHTLLYCIEKIKSHYVNNICDFYNFSKNIFVIFFTFYDRVFRSLGDFNARDTIRWSYLITRYRC